MQRLIAFIHSRRRWLVIPALVLGCGLYISQVVSAWAIQEQMAVSDVVQRSASGTAAWRSPQTKYLEGMDIAQGSTGAFRFNPYDPIGILTVRDLPILPPKKVYQLWCIDVLGHIEPGTFFTMDIDTVSEFTILVAAPRLFSAYVRFEISIEPAGGSMQPTSSMIMRVKH